MGRTGSGAPTGTLAFLFTDIEGSTRLWAADESAMSAALEVHDRVLRSVIAEHGGHVFATAGDSFAAAFGRASEAVRCATALQSGLADADWGAGPALRVRMGAHLGEADERDGNYFGPTLNRAARVMAAAHGGQCIITEQMRDAAGVVAVDLGTHRLRDIDEPVHLFQVGPGDFPPPWSVGAGIVSLPLPRTSLIGRTESVATVRRLIADHSMVTLTGVGGCGKTRLAIEVGHEEVPTHLDGVWFVDLSVIADETALPGAFATALGITLAANDEPEAQIVAYLEPRDALLIVDNCEHLVDDVADLLDALLGRCSGLRVLATSRESLEIEGEYTWKVPSLATGVDSDAVALFVDRAAAAGASLTIDGPTEEIIADIVERLDGIPLAVELAAARARSMGLAEIRERLDDRFRLLSGGKRRSRQRQATLEAAVAWSYELLSEEERSMLRCLAVFQGGFAPTDVAAVAGLDDIASVDLLDALAAKSLVDVTQDGRGQLRHRLLETIRMFALARLIDGGEVVEVRDRHLEHFLADPVGASLSAWFDIDGLWRIDLEFENFRAAAIWANERNRNDACVRIAAVISDAAPARGDLRSVLDWLQLPAELSPRDRVFTAAVLAHALNVEGDVVRSSVAADLAIALGREHPCEDLVFAMFTRATVAGMTGELQTQEDLLLEAQRLARASFSPLAQAGADMFVLTSIVGQVRWAEAIALADASLALAPTFGYRHITEAWRAFALLMDGQIEAAQQAVDEFSPAPPSSQWTHMNLVVASVVSAKRYGVEQAARQLAAQAGELVAQRPAIAADLLSAFAFFALLEGERDRAREIVSHTRAFGTGPLQTWCVLELNSVAPNAATDEIAAWYAEAPIDAIVQLSAQHAPRLLAEEIARWS